MGNKTIMTREERNQILQVYSNYKQIKTSMLQSNYEDEKFTNEQIDNHLTPFYIEFREEFQKITKFGIVKTTFFLKNVFIK